MKKRKHKQCSYMLPSVDGRRKTTIKNQQKKNEQVIRMNELDRLSKMYRLFY